MCRSITAAGSSITPSGRFATPMPRSRRRALRRHPIATLSPRVAKADTRVPEASTLGQRLQAARGASPVGRQRQRSQRWQVASRRPCSGSSAATAPRKKATLWRLSQEDIADPGWRRERSGGPVRLLATLLGLYPGRAPFREPGNARLHARSRPAVRRRRAHGGDPRVPVRDLPTGHRHPVDAVRLAPGARLLVAIRQLARGRRRPRRKGQALRPSGAQHQPVPHPCPQAGGASPARRAHLPHQGLPLHGARLQVELKRLRRGQHRQYDDARKPAAAARGHLDHAARGLVSEPGLYRGRPHQLVCAVLQPASH